MNFGASHIVQTSALLKKDSKRSSATVFTLHAAPKCWTDCHHSESFNSPRSEASRHLWGAFSEGFEPQSLLVEQANFRQYEAAAEIVLEQLRETLELSIDELRRHKAFKWNFERFLDTFEGTRNGKRPSFVTIQGIISKVLETLFVHGARSATPDFKDKQAGLLLRAYLQLKQEQELL